jgi:enoyl-CoA hydratase/carnithine racemase
VGDIKRAVQAGAETSLEQGLALERELHARLLASHDAKEGILAHIQKRRPTFRAR